MRLEECRMNKLYRNRELDSVCKQLSTWQSVSWSLITEHVQINTHKTPPYFQSAKDHKAEEEKWHSYPTHSCLQQERSKPIAVLDVNRCSKCAAIDSSADIKGEKQCLLKLSHMYTSLCICVVNYEELILELVKCPFFPCFTIIAHDASTAETWFITAQKDSECSAISLPPAAGQTVTQYCWMVLKWDS